MVFSQQRAFSPIVLKSIALLALTLQNTALVLVTKFSYRKAAEPYAVSTVVVCSECVKCISSVLLMLCTGENLASRRTLFETHSSALRIALPSILYVIQNNLLFEGVRLLNPTSYMVCSQVKILTSAFFAFVLLKTAVTRRQCFALFLLVFGMILVQCVGVTSNTITAYHSPLTGLAMVFAAACTSGFAGAYLEKIYKESGENNTHSIWFRNLQLACFSVPVAMCAMIWKDSQIVLLRGVFYGYDVFVVVIIILQAIGGLVVAVVMRYASNVMKCFAISLSICNCAFVTSYLFPDTSNAGLSAHQMLGIGLVIGSTFLYTMK